MKRPATVAVHRMRVARAEARIARARSRGAPLEDIAALERALDGERFELRRAERLEAEKSPREAPSLVPGVTRWGSWTYVRPSEADDGSGAKHVLVRCACGVEVSRNLSHLRQGQSMRCFDCNKQRPEVRGGVAPTPREIRPFLKAGSQ